MESLNSLDVPIEVAEPRTGMAQAVLRELIEQLAELAQSGHSQVVDISSLPMNASDKRELAELLGKGEVTVSLSTIGDSEIYETAYAGIWWVKHYSADDQLIAELIEVTRVPDIIISHADDIQQAAVEIKRIIDQDDSSYDTGDGV